MGDKNISKNISENLTYYMNLHGLNNRELGEKIGVSESTVGKWILMKSTPRMGVIERLANLFGIETSDMIEEHTHGAEKEDYATIPVYGVVPAGIPIESIESILGYEDISFKEFNRDKKYIGLKVVGDSMFPKYLEGDTIILEVTPEFVSGQDCVVYVNGYDATLKTVRQNQDGTITLQPINPNYPPKTYGKSDDNIKILGVVKELRRKI